MTYLKPIPGIAKRPFWQKQWFEALLAGIPPIVGALVAAANIWDDDTKKVTVKVLLGIAAWLSAAALVRCITAGRKDAESDPARSHDGLRAATLLLHSAAAQICNMSPDEADKHLRVTFHRIVPPLENATVIEQIVPYAGGRATGAGRHSSINVGITGMAIRNDEPILMSSVGSEAELREQLVSVYGYTAAQVRQLTPGRVSALAVPVYDRGRRQTLGVIYLDSDKTQLFDADETYQAILAVCDGFSRYVSERY